MQSKPRRRKWLWILLGCAGLVVIAGGLWFGGVLPPGASRAQSQSADSTDSAVAAAKPEEVPVPVELCRAERRGIAAFYRAASVIEADRLVDLVAKVQGRMQVLNVEEGDWINEDQVLAELENDREKIQLRQAELRLAEKKRLLDRNQSMQQEGLISTQEYDEVKAAYDLAETERDLARVALDETVMRAPFAGQISDRKVVLGQQVNPGQSMFTLADFEPLRVRVHLPEAIARKVAAGQRVLVYPEATAEPVEAVIERIAPVVDPVTSTMRITLLLQGRAEKAYVGGFVKVRITTDTHQEALAIPKLALVEEGGLRSVFVAEADTVRKVEIRTGLYDETHIEILDGLVEAEYVVSLGQGGLRTGSRIDVLNAEEVAWVDARADSTSGPTDAQLALTPDD